MESQHQWLLLFVVPFFLCLTLSKNVNSTNELAPSIDVSTAYCCRFASDACGFLVTGTRQSWYWSGDGNYPDYTLFPNFRNNSNYLWTQEVTDATTVTPQLEKIQDSTQFGFNYYASTDDPYSHIYVYFSNYNGDPDVLISSLQGTGLLWLHHSFTCGESKCCESYPCDGYIKVVAYVDSYLTLYAIDDVEVNNGCSPTTSTSPIPTTQSLASATPSPEPKPTTQSLASATPSPEPKPTTSALPPGPGCCDFATDTCGFSYRSPPQKGSWEWSGSGNTPNSTLFPLFPGDDNSYIFTQNDDESFTYSPDVTVDATTEIGLTFYAHIEDTTGTSSLQVYFEHSDGSPDALIDVLDETDEKWQYNSLTCGSHGCCESYPCAGRIKVIADVNNLNTLYAIDEVEINNACSK